MICFGCGFGSSTVTYPSATEASAPLVQGLYSTTIGGPQCELIGTTGSRRGDGLHADPTHFELWERDTDRPP